MVTDPISDFLIQIKNASRAGKEAVAAPYSKLKAAIAETLVRAGFITAAAKSANGRTLNVTLAYNNETPKVTDVARVSKPSRRMYQSASEVKPFKNGFGAVILSTPKGILLDREAIKHNVGGEIMFKIW